jgi:hypothetical protein
MPSLTGPQRRLGRSSSSSTSERFKNMTRLLAYLLLSLILSTAAQAQIRMPPGGTTVDERQTVSLPTVMPKHCISLNASGASVILSRTDVESVATMPAVGDWVTEDERLLKIRQNRAKMLLESLSGKTDAYGCSTLEQAEAGDSVYLFTQAINDLSAVVVDANTEKRVERVSVQFIAHAGANGIISYLLPNGRPFLTLLWWIA